MYRLGNFPLSSKKKRQNRDYSALTALRSQNYKNATSSTEDDLSILCMVSNCSREHFVGVLGPANFSVTNKLKCPF